MPPKPRKNQIKFVVLSADEARGQKPKGTLSALRKTSRIYTDRLWLTDDQRRRIEHLYKSSTPGTHLVSQEYSPLSSEEQLAAAAFLASEGLDIGDGRASLGNRWSSRWVDVTGTAMWETKRELFQCDCGYDHTSRNCLAHAEVLSSVASGTHNDACKNAFVTRIPPLPLHDSLSLGANLGDIQATNRQLGQPSDIKDSPHRWLLRKSDTRSLYRQFNRLRGIRTAVQPQVNVDQWLDPSSPSYNKSFAAAVFHYNARAEKGDRFEVCIATKEMRDAASKYGHDSQIILDGTFGVCDRKVLLGVPLAFFLFSAPSGNAQTSSGYNTEILTKLLHSWKTDMERHQNGPFAPCERGALVKVFPEIWLLICKFHLRHVKGSTTLHQQVRARLKLLENALAIANERAVIAADVEPVDVDVAASVVEHLNYLENYWLQESLWRSWSQYGRLEAAKRLRCEVEGVLPTTNHLESFNGVLKRKHLRRFQRGGRRLRIDVLLHLLVINVLPSIFEARKLEQAEDLRWQSKLGRLPGGTALVQQKNERNSSLHSHRKGRLAVARPRYALLTVDPGRDAAATELVEARQISVPTFDDQTRTFEFECFSSLATDTDVAPLLYKLSIGVDGSAACSCPDFSSREIACKHLRAALTQLAALRSQGIYVPDINLPATYEEARTRFHTHTPIVASGDTAAPPVPPSMLVTRHTAQLVDDIIRESGDIFAAGVQPDADRDESESGVESDPDSTDEELDADEDEPPVLPEMAKSRVPQELKPKGFEGAREGVVRQAVARVLHELEGISPSLQQMRDLLKGAYLDISERTASTLLPPSPEKLQKRQDSYSIH
ncbi:hypothetical protein LXA43DRAFT_977888 [Ganoderma leucocontextum]|nr:hypothetical protein LXA43DRAFT_977888 [Ganoderma leucocontextum]